MSAPKPTFDVDLFVIGGGSGGVRAARVAAEAGARVAVRTGRLLPRSARRRRRCRNSPTTPRRKNETQTMKIRPITTVTRSPMVAR